MLRDSHQIGFCQAQEFHLDPNVSLKDVEEDMRCMSDIDIHYLVRDSIDKAPSLHRYLVALSFFFHPQLSGITLSASAKLRILLRLTTHLLEEGHRILVFSQWVTILNIIASAFESQHIPFLRIDGQVRTSWTFH